MSNLNTRDMMRLALAADVALDTIRRWASGRPVQRKSKLAIEAAAKRLKMAPKINSKTA